MNFYDSEKMSDLLMNHGYATTDTQEDADLIIVNTCHIREKASEILFSDLGRIKKIKDKKRLTVAVTGCVAQAEGEQISARAPFVDLITGPQSYHRLPEMLRKIANGKSISPLLEFTPNEKFDNLEYGKNKKGPTSFVSIQEGCDKFCTFCVVPYTRGAEFSRSISEITDEVNNLADHGVIEVTLLGQNVNSWHGADYKGKERGLAYLINEISNIKKIKRIRYTTSHPLDMDEELILAHKNIKKLMPYLHLPVQSGSDKILNAMNRKHTATDYITIIDKIRKINPEIALSGDFIVGFPGETNKDFNDTIRLINEVQYAQSYSFKYSERPGTPASVLDFQVPENEKRIRLEKLQEILFEQQEKYNSSFLGKEVEVLIEKTGGRDDQIMGRSQHMQSVYMNKDLGKIGEIKKVKISYAGKNSLKV
jgi:tRNA-2-methylthio-N6-dimethylallyladenosine synthase